MLAYKGLNIHDGEGRDGRVYWAATHVVDMQGLVSVMKLPGKPLADWLEMVVKIFRSCMWEKLYMNAHIYIVYEMRKEINDKELRDVVRYMNVSER